jgi:hypothetical protein
MMHGAAPGVGKPTLMALVCGIIGAVLVAVAFMFDRQQSLLAWLYAWVFFLGLSLGSMALLMLQALTGGRWEEPVRAPLAAAMRILPVMAVLSIPLLVGLPELFRWARPDAVAASLLLQRKHWYLNPPFFIIRAVIDFVLWSGLSIWLFRLKVQEKKQADGHARLRRLSAGGEVIFVLLGLFAGVDWVMSLLPEWTSTIFGMIFCISQALGAMAFAVAMAGRACARAPADQVNVSVLSNRFHDLGNLMLMLVLLWTYLASMQYLIIWSENLPHEISWYVPRLQTSWIWVTWLVVFLQFIIPGALLLFRAIKRDFRRLTWVALLLLAANLIYTWWLVTPTLRPAGFSLPWADIAALVGVGGLWLAAYLWLLEHGTALGAVVTEEGRHG